MTQRQLGIKINSEIFLLLGLFQLAEKFFWLEALPNHQKEIGGTL